MARMIERRRDGRGERGVALLFAIGVLFLFSMLGAAYVTNMGLSVDGADLSVREARARLIAAGGVNAAIADLQRGLAEGQLGAALAPATHAFPSYANIFTGEGVRLEALENRKAEAQVRITDESGKVNLNHAPASILQEVLGVDGAVARGIVASLPSASGTGQWLLGVDDLLSRKLLTPEQYAAVNRDLVTTWTVPDHSDVKGHLNVNAAGAEVLAAITGVPLEAAQQATVQRPFASLAALSAAVGKEPGTFNIPPDPFAPEALPAALALESRCFRIVSDAVYSNISGGRERYRTRARVDAVVLFDADGGYRIVHWDEQRTEAAPGAA